ncbi:grasp-with-spasm system ATP-grasp peptide maturase [Agarilytica rhodophyticola]|uniref:grasp-with-spasm system ATP-grasp peptide maturase n=1 Tax=Agarilytica rhodophyticola TaxID=1737490 RepID=UPI000B340F59|nr:grasp-with-spasm system ATP-grasp peptide maturase [Agarilytica rhodophyticola]
MSKLILIISEEADLSTETVIDWIDYIGYSFIRINENDTITLNKLVIDDGQISFTLEVDGRLIYSDNIHGVWYRRGFINMHIDINISEDIPNYELVESFIQRDRSAISEFFHMFLHQEYRGLGIQDKTEISKLTSLYYAQKAGLMVPQSLSTSRKESALTFMHSGEYICKGLHMSTGLTKSITHDCLSNLDEYFMPSLIQRRIKKAYELRIFYLSGTCYSMAIFSQLDSKTEIDFRNYNDEKPNRTVPYKLPKVIEEKLVLFMNYVGLDSGSIDIIVTDSNDYIFLEVNPVGQFEMTSYPCNYNLSKKITEYLIG